MHRSHVRLLTLSLACAGALAVAVSARSLSQDPPPQTPPAQDPAEPGAGRGNGRAGGAQGPRPYAQVVTAAFKTDDGVFKVHRGTLNGTDSVLFEIPKAELDRDFVWDVSIRKTTLGAGYGGQNVSSHVVRWTKRGDRILLLGVDYSTTAEPGTEVAQAVADANYPSIIRSLPVLAYAPGGDAVVDATPFFMEAVPEFQARAAIGGRGLAADRSFLETTHAFPDNINVESTLTFTGNDNGGGGGGRGGGGAAGMRGSSGTVLVHHSIMRLPDAPMMERNYDARVGFATEAVVDYGTEEHRSVNEAIINRFRLDKKDAAAAVSDPVKPIVFYVDPATPAKFVPFVKRGIESWQAAFEAAGFSNAIVAKDAPANDPEWSAEDARYSIVRWVPTQTEQQTLIHDPRSGEIISASVNVYPNAAGFGPTWYFVQAAGVDTRAQKLPLPDDINGELIRFQVAHGVGHALGLTHNNKASSTYTIAQVRDPKWVKDNGFVASIMDDTRFNYVAQPEDHVDPADLIPKIGPYDKFAIRWGYSAVPSARKPSDEKSALDAIVQAQETTPYLRYSTEGAAASDPGDSPEAVGDADPVMATTLGMKNLTRVAAIMFPATTTKVGEPWDDLETVYGRMVNQWTTEMNHVVKVVGGLDSRQVHIGQQGVRFSTVPKLKQQAALNYVLANAFQVPAFMIDKDVLRRIQASGAVDRVKAAQRDVLNTLLQNARLDRMTEQMTIDGPSIAYAPLQFLQDVRNGVWSEVGKPGAISIYRRNLQRSYLDIMDDKLNGPGNNSEVRMLVKGELRALDKQLQTGLAVAGLDENTRRHLADSREEIAAILDPRVSRPAADASAAPGAGRGRGGVR